MTEEEVARRLPVWVALSGLFLDTEPTPEDYDRIAAVVAAASLGRVEARDVLWREVAPVFGSNLLAPIGEWAGWPDDFVRERVLDWVRGGGPGSLSGWFAAAICAPLVRDAWREVERRLP